MRAVLKRFRVPLVVLLVHTLLVFAVYRSWLVASQSPERYDDPALQWLWPFMFDLPSSLIVERMHPSYGIQAVAAFSVIGGIQWILISGALAWFFSRLRHATPTI